MVRMYKVPTQNTPGEERKTSRAGKGGTQPSPQMCSTGKRWHTGSPSSPTSIPAYLRACSSPASGARQLSSGYRRSACFSLKSRQSSSALPMTQLKRAATRGSVFGCARILTTQAGKASTNPEDANLCGKNGVLASPFKTDDYPISRETGVVTDFGPGA